MATKPTRRFVIIDGNGATLVHAMSAVAALHTYEAHRAKEAPPPPSSSKPFVMEPISIYELADEIKGPA